MSCSPYAHPGFAEICILHRTWSTVALGTYELAFWIKKKSHGQISNTLSCASIGGTLLSMPAIQGLNAKPYRPPISLVHCQLTNAMS